MMAPLAALAVGATMLAGTAMAQSSPSTNGPSFDKPSPRAGSPDRTGSIAPTGQTKPPGAPVGDNLGLTPELRKRDRAIERQIEQGICKGCN